MILFSNPYELIQNFIVTTTPIPGYTFSTGYFGANWMNFTVHFPQVGYLEEESTKILKVSVSDHFHLQREDNDYSTINNRTLLTDNNIKIAGSYTNAKWFPRSDLHWTDIIEVSLNDIRKLGKVTLKGFNSDDVGELASNYRNGEDGNLDWDVTEACPYNGGKVNGYPNGSVDTKTYFYKGFGEANCIKYLFELGLVVE